MTTLEDLDPGTPIAIPTRPDEARIARRERLRLLLRSPTFILGAIILGFWIVCAVFGTADRAAEPPGRRHPQQARGARRRTTCSAPTGSAATFSPG